MKSFALAALAAIIPFLPFQAFAQSTTTAANATVVINATPSVGAQPRQVTLPLNQLSTALTFSVTSLQVSSATNIAANTITCFPYRDAAGTISGGLPFTLTTSSLLSTNPVTIGSIRCTSNATTTTTVSRTTTSQITTTLAPARTTTLSGGQVSTIPARISTLPTTFVLASTGTGTVGVPTANGTGTFRATGSATPSSFAGAAAGLGVGRARVLTLFGGAAMVAASGLGLL